ncbi:MAG: DUF1553 domain-containing protein, partial [Planctomycetota bacterium]
PQSSGLAVADAHQHWAYRPLQTQFTSDSVDEFVNSRLRERDLQAEHEASRIVLIRRLYFDLTGLPPSPDEIETFCNDPAPDAYERLVDRLLSSPAYGEHVARRWLDVARYAESITLRGFVLDDAWRYRDYVIQAYNEDRPFDQMIRDQIAGDLIEHSSLRERRMSSVATGFLALANTNLEDQDKTKLEFDHIDEQLTTIGRAFLGQTIGCARCHDHKFDPIPTADYYALAAIFRSTIAFKHDNLSKWIRKPVPIESHRESEFARAQLDLDELRPRLTEINQAIRKHEKDGAEETSEIASLRNEKSQLEKRSRGLSSFLKKRPMYISIAEGEPVSSLEIRIRGNTHQRGRPVERGFLTAFGPAQEFASRIPSDQSGRAELAGWIADSRNPLTARVYANRVWSWMMGEGIVSTENNFGTAGSLPTHPNLLDWLAGELVRHNWSTKHLVRTIVCSQSYRRRSDSIRHQTTDAENQWLWRANRKRIPVEAMKDSMSSLAGQIEFVMGGSEIRPNTGSDYEYHHESKRRSIYWPVFRNSPPPLYTVFDFANSSVSVGQRPESTIPTQALAIANHPWVIEQARRAADRFVPAGNKLSKPQLRKLFITCIGRPPTPDESTAARAFLAAEDGTGSKSDEKLAMLIHSLFASIDFRYLD